MDFLIDKDSLFFQYSLQMSEDLFSDAACYTRSELLRYIGNNFGLFDKDAYAFILYNSNRGFLIEMTNDPEPIYTR